VFRHVRHQLLVVFVQLRVLAASFGGDAIEHACMDKAGRVTSGR
jgi:hypothetical protein